MKRWKHGLALGGFVAAVVAVLSDQAIAVWVAIALLAGSFILRLIERSRARRTASARDSLSEGRDAQSGQNGPTR